MSDGPKPKFLNHTPASLEGSWLLWPGLMQYIILSGTGAKRLNGKALTVSQHQVCSHDKEPRIGTLSRLRV